tara:strand:- start:3753 stop:4049 length:297 start_codon:yes stop_codon:yes gene_type:complete
MSRNLSPPSFPIPPREYDQRFFYEFLRAFTQYQFQVQNPGEGRNTFIVFTDLQSNDQGLEQGAVFRNGNYFLKVSVINQPNVGGLKATGGVGQVTKAP